MLFRGLAWSQSPHIFSRGGDAFLDHAPWSLASSQENNCLSPGEQYSSPPLCTTQSYPTEEPGSQIYPILTLPGYPRLWEHFGEALGGRHSLSWENRNTFLQHTLGALTDATFPSVVLNLPEAGTL